MARAEGGEEEEDKQTRDDKDRFKPETLGDALGRLSHLRMWEVAPAASDLQSKPWSPRQHAARRPDQTPYRSLSAQKGIKNRKKEPARSEKI